MTLSRRDFLRDQSVSLRESDHLASAAVGDSQALLAEKGFADECVETGEQ